MTKSETISNIKAYLDGDTAIGNIIPLRSVLESAVWYLETPQETIKGWVARDRSYNLSLYTYMPIRLLMNNEWSLPLDHEGDEIEIPIPDNLFPALQWEDEPIEVEFIIRPLWQKKK